MRRLSLVLLALLAGCAVVNRPPRTERARLDSLKRDFLARASQLGTPLLFEPEIREWTRPELTIWLAQPRVIAYPRFSELPSADRALMSAWAGSEEDARRLFTWTYRWLFVARETARALDSVNGAPEDPAAAERAANDIAVAFLKGEPGGKAALDKLEVDLRALLKRMPRAPRDEDKLFDRNCGDRSFEFARCAASELRLAYESVQLRDQLDFDLELEGVRARRLRARAAAAAATSVDGSVVR